MTAAAGLQIIAGLRKHVPLEAMQSRLVVCIANLKTAKLAGELLCGGLGSHSQSLTSCVCRPEQ